MCIFLHYIFPSRLPFLICSRPNCLVLIYTLMKTQSRKHNAYPKKHDVDIYDFLSSYFILLDREYYAYLTASYEDYKHTFLATKLNHIFTSNLDMNWFKEFYLNDQSNLSTTRLTSFLSNNEYYMSVNLDSVNTLTSKCLSYSTANIFVNNIQSILTHDHLLSIVSQCPGFLSLNMSLTFQKQYFQRTAIISVTSETDVQAAINFLNSINDQDLHFSPLIFNNMAFNQVDFIVTNNDLCYLQKLVQIFYNKYNIKETVVLDCTVDYYILLLRVVFCYCYYCCVQYCSHVEMVRCCGDYHIRTGLNNVRSLFDRKNKILLLKVDYERVRELYIKGETEYKMKDNGFICGKCKKEFESKETYSGHYQSKHFDVELKEKYECFMGNLDIFLLGRVFGTYSNNLPWFVRDLEIEYTYLNDTVYDYGCVFSGSIELRNDKNEEGQEE